MRGSAGVGLNVQIYLHEFVKVCVAPHFSIVSFVHWPKGVYKTVSLFVLWRCCMFMSNKLIVNRSSSHLSQTRVLLLTTRLEVAINNLLARRQGLTKKTVS